MKERSVVQHSWEWCLEQGCPKGHEREMMATPRNSGAKDKSAASSMESKGSTDAGLKTCMRWGGAKRSYKEKWPISQKDKEGHLRHLTFLSSLRGGCCHLGRRRFLEVM